MAIYYFLIILNQWTKVSKNSKPQLQRSAEKLHAVN